MKKQIRISDLCTHLSENCYSDIEIENHTDVYPSPDRIRQIAMEKLHRQSQPEETVGEPAVSEKSPSSEKGKVMKKNTMRIFILAAAVCLLSATAFAAVNGLSYFQSIFGSSAAVVQKNIQSPSLSNSNREYRLTVKSLLSDGYKTNIVVSLESLKGNKVTEEPSELFSVQVKNKSGTVPVQSYKCEAMKEFQTEKQSFYRLEVSGLQSQLSSTIEVSLNNQNEALKIDVPVRSSTTAKTVQLDAKAYEKKNYLPENIQLSPLGILIIGSEQKAKGSLPGIEVAVLMKDGSKEEMMSAQSFDTSETGGTVTAGGGVCLDDGPQKPLVAETMAMRNPDGKIVSTGYFSRILDLKQVKAIVVDGTEYVIGS